MISQSQNKWALDVPGAAQSYTNDYHSEENQSSEMFLVHYRGQKVLYIEVIGHYAISVHKTSE